MNSSATDLNTRPIDQTSLSIAFAPTPDAPPAPDFSFNKPPLRLYIELNAHRPRVRGPSHSSQGGDADADRKNYQTNPILATAPFDVRCSMFDVRCLLPPSPQSPVPSPLSPMPQKVTQCHISHTLSLHFPTISPHPFSPSSRPPSRHRAFAVASFSSHPLPLRLSTLSSAPTPPHYANSIINNH